MDHQLYTTYHHSMRSEYLIYNRGHLHPYLKNFVAPLSRVISKDSKLTVFSLGDNENGEIKGEFFENNKSLLMNFRQVYIKLRSTNVKKIFCLTENQAIAIKIISWLAKSNAKVVLYKQGALYEEKKYLKSSLPSLHWLIEAASLRLSDEVIFISRAMRDYYQCNFKFNGVHWIINNKISHPQRIEHITQDPISIAYSGSTGNWQCFGYITELMSKLIETTKVECFVYTNDPVTLKDKRIKVKKVNQSELISRLSDHDFGIIVREQHKLNIVSSPLKIGEYLSAGLHIIMTQGIGDYSEELRMRGLCTFISGVNAKADLEIIRELIHFKSQATQQQRLQEKNRASDFSKDHFCSTEDFEQVL